MGLWLVVNIAVVEFMMSKGGRFLESGGTGSLCTHCCGWMERSKPVTWSHAQEPPFVFLPFSLNTVRRSGSVPYSRRLGVGGRGTLIGGRRFVTFLTN